METELLSGFLNQFEGLTKKPEKYITTQDDEAELVKLLTKQLYDLTKRSENLRSKNPDVLEELIIKNLDEEQIWQQIELQNNSVYNTLVTDTANVLAKKDILSFPLQEKKRKKPALNEDDGESSVSAERPKKIITKKEERIKPKNLKSSVVDDKFFKLYEMEEFLEKVEKEEETQENEDSNIDYFEEDVSDEDDEDEMRYHYSDFFDQPYDEEIQTKRVKFNLEDENASEEEDSKNSLDGLGDALDEDDDEMENDADQNDNDAEDDDDEMENDIDQNDSDTEDDDDDDDDDINENEDDSNSKSNNSKNPSTFEARQERLKMRIQNLEEEALKEKPWQLKGEVTAKSRPQNSLLEEYVEFDIAARPAPVLTEKSTLKLEDVIIQRIKDKAWDDVVRKFKPVENDFEYKKKLVLDQEKSKLSLAQIYEQEYLKQLDNKNESGTEKPEVEPPEYQEIRNIMNNLFDKLDALSNFHFTPKQVKPEIKIVNNLPAITMEEVAPVATSDATLLAPEEVKPKSKGDLIGKSERTVTDKKRERRQKKLKQKLKYKQMEAKAKLNLEKSNSKDLNNKKISQKLLQKITKSSNITQLESSKDDKYIKSSSTFFSKLQSETSSKIKKKGVKLNKMKLGKLSAKKSKAR